MMLKDNQGRTVIIKENGYNFSFWAKNEDTMEQVSDAVICKGNDHYRSGESFCCRG